MPNVVSASEKPRKQEAQEGSTAQSIYLSFSFSGVVNTIITAFYLNDSVYIPISAVFKQLRVDNSVDMRSKVLRGFYIEPSEKYEIDFSRGIARIGGKEIVFDTSKVIVGQLDFYVLPSFFRKVFNLGFIVDFSSLSLFLRTSQELPVVRDHQREIMRRYLVSSPGGNLVQAPLRFPRNRSLLNGGVVDYSLTAFSGGGAPNYNYALTGGAEILGGETEGSVSGSFSGSSSNIYSSDFSWKYAVDSSAYLTYAALGNLSSNGLTQYGYRGAQISNEPLAIRTLFGEYTVKAKTNPGWEVELYVNDQLVGYKRADSEGRAEFSIPMVYGTSFIQIKYYGPDGEFSETDRRLQIPFTFIPAGQVNYTISAGKVDNTDYNFLSGNAVFGVSDWMTDRIGMDYLDSPLFSKPLFYNSLYLRLATEYTLSVDAAPLAYYKSTFSGLYSSLAAFDLSYSRYEQNPLYNPGLKLQEAQADAYLPFSISHNSLNFRVAGDAEEYVGGEKSYNYSAYFSTSIPQVNASVGYQRSIIDFGGGGTVQTHDYTGTVLYSLLFPSGPFDFLNDTFLNVTGRYGVLKNSLDDISFQLSRNVRQYIRVAFTAERDYINKSTSFNIQVIADLPFTRSTSTSQFQNGSGYYSENVSGSIGFDSNYGHLSFNNLGWVGNSAASIRMFVDANGNGKYDPGEEVIKEGNVSLGQAVSTERSSNGIVRDWNLLPYTRYSANVDVNSIRNPLWIPEMKSFSFITDPDSYKKIDIPFFVGGVVDGHVLKSQDGRLSAVPGLMLEIESASGEIKKSIAVFNDGSFYYMGLPPGKYEAHVDSSQLAVLGVYEVPKKLLFDVKATKNGDFVEGLNILLKSVEGKKVGESPRKAPALTTFERPAKPSLHVKPPVAFSVQIGAFTDRESALKFADEAKARTGREIGVSFNNDTRLYLVRTGEFKSKQTAAGVLTDFISKFHYTDAFMVSASEQGNRYLFSVQIAAFHSMTAAVDYSDNISRETGLQPSVQFRRSTQLFSVMVGQFTNREKCQKAADTLKKMPAFRDAFVTVYGLSKPNRMYAVLVGSFMDHGAAVSCAVAFQRRTGFAALVDFDGREREFIVITPTFITRAAASAALTKIRSYKEYLSSRVISLP